MPTKPTLSAILTWAEDPTFTLSDDPDAVGEPVILEPTTGQKNQGIISGDTFKGQWVNWLLRDCARAAAWVRDGSNAGAANAHLVETDATGKATLNKILVTDTMEFAKTSGTEDAAFAVTVSGLNLSLDDSAGPASLSLSIASTGISLALQESGATFDLALGGSGIVMQTDGGIALAATGGGSNPGLQGTGGGSAGSGVKGIAGTTGVGVEGLASAATGYGVVGQTHAAGTSAAAAVRGVGLADAMAVWGQAVDGYGVVAQSDTTSPKRAALRVVPQNAEPTTVLEGDVIVNSAIKALQVYEDSAWMPVWASAGGMAYLYQDTTTSTPLDNASTTDWVTLTSNSFGVGERKPRKTGTVTVRGHLEVSSSTGATTGQVEVRLLDSVSGEIKKRLIVLSRNSTGADERDVYISADVNLSGNVGDRTFSLQFRAAGGGTAYARWGGIEVGPGVFT